MLKFKRKFRRLKVKRIVTEHSSIETVDYSVSNFSIVESYWSSRDSQVSIVTRLRAERFGFQFPAGTRNFFVFTETSRSVLRSIQPLIKWLPGASYPGLKRPGREVKLTSCYCRG